MHDNDDDEDEKGSEHFRSTEDTTLYVIKHRITQKAKGIVSTIEIITEKQSTHHIDYEKWQSTIDYDGCNPDLEEPVSTAISQLHHFVVLRC